MQIAPLASVTRSCMHTRRRLVVAAGIMSTFLASLGSA
jgi:hypothetical protein